MHFALKPFNLETFSEQMISLNKLELQTRDVAKDNTLNFDICSYGIRFIAYAQTYKSTWISCVSFVVTDFDCLLLTFSTLIYEQIAHI